MQYNFDEVINRRTTNSLKWDIPQNELPMWVADMDFQAAPAIIKALEERVHHGIYGYNIIPDAWYDAIISWWSRRHHLSIEKEWLTFTTGVIPAITSAVKRITNIGDNVVVQTPVYDIFFHSIENTGRHVLENPLRYRQGVYEIDFEDLEENLSNELTTMMILCNPHNPVGKIWSREELKKIGELCRKYNVTVVSDEIHCDLTNPGEEYIPFASVSELCKEISMTCISATKAFNIAGLQSSAVVIANEELRNKVVRGLNSDEVAEPNTFAIEAVIAAFNESENWLNELNVYIYENKKTVIDFLNKELPKLQVIVSNATYLLWIDCAQFTSDSSKLADYLRRSAGLYLSSGDKYRGNGSTFLRMNVACPRTQVLEGLSRLKRGLLTYQE